MRQLRRLDEAYVTEPLTTERPNKYGQFVRNALRQHMEAVDRELSLHDELQVLRALLARQLSLLDRSMGEGLTPEEAVLTRTARSIIRDITAIVSTSDDQMTNAQLNQLLTDLIGVLQQRVEPEVLERVIQDIEALPCVESSLPGYEP